MDKKYLVTFEIMTKQMNLEELSSRIGIPYSDSSYNLGEMRGKGKTEHSLWKLESTLGEESSIEEQCEEIFANLKSSRILEPGVLPSDSKCFIDIAVFYYTFTCSAHISDKVTKLFEPFNADIHLSCYPCSEKPESYNLEEYPEVEAVDFPKELYIAYAVCDKTCGAKGFIVDGQTQVCEYCGKNMFRTEVKKYCLDSE